MNTDDRSMVVLEWTLHEVSHLVRRYTYLEKYPLPLVAQILMQVYEGNVIEFLWWGWQELERYEALVCPNENGTLRDPVARPCARVRVSASFPQPVTSERCCPLNDRMRLH